MKALIISADHFEDSELLFPFYRLQEEGVDVYIASIARGKITGKHGYEVVVDTALRDVDPKEYDMLILPGGKAPTKLHLPRPTDFDHGRRSAGAARHLLSLGCRGAARVRCAIRRCGGGGGRQSDHLQTALRPASLHA